MKNYLLFFFASFLCASLCYSVSVGTADELITQFTGGESTLETEIEVTADLDFSGHTLPLGASSNGKCVASSGVF